MLDLKFIMDYESVRDIHSIWKYLLAQIIPTIIQHDFYPQAHRLQLGQTFRICPEAHNDGDFQGTGFKERSISSKMGICWFNMQSDQITLKYLWVPWKVFLP